MIYKLLSASVISTALCGPVTSGTMGNLSTVSDNALLRFYGGVGYSFGHSLYKHSATLFITPTTPTVIDPSRVLKNDISAYEFYAGFRHNQYVGFELGFVQVPRVSKITTTSDTTSSVSLIGRMFYADLKLYYPVQNWDIYGIAGVSAYAVNGPVQFSTPAGVLADEIANGVGILPSLGLGVDYNYTQHLGVRFEGKYAFVQNPFSHGMVGFNTGLYYFF